MPTYEYRCDECESVFEVHQSIKDDALKSCTCDKASDKIQRIISKNGGGFILKGSGFYNTDYKNAGSATKTETKTETAAPACGAGGCGSGACAANAQN